MDYLKELEKHGVSLAEFPLLKILDSFPLYGYKHVRKFVSIDAHPWVMSLQKALEAFTDKVLLFSCFFFSVPQGMLYAAVFVL